MTVKCEICGKFLNHDGKFSTVEIESVGHLTPPDYRPAHKECVEHEERRLDEHMDCYQYGTVE